MTLIAPVCNRLHMRRDRHLCQSGRRATIATAKRGLKTWPIGTGQCQGRQTATRFAKTVGETDIVLFAGITGDFSDTHINDQYMKERSNLGGRIAHGALLVGYMSTASTISIAHIIHQEGLTDFPVSAGYDKLRFLKPVMLGDTVTVT